MLRLDYLSCFLTVVATILVGRKMWTGLVVSGVNSLIVCVIGLHTSQYGFIPANVFCICINVFNLRAWLKVQRNLSESTTDANSELVAGCTCNGNDQIGLAPVKIEDDPTLRRGDIVAGSGGLMVAGRGADRRGASLNFSPAPDRIRSRYQRVPVMASE